MLRFILSSLALFGTAAFAFFFEGGSFVDLFLPSPLIIVACVAGFAVLTLYFTGLFPPFGNPNELSRVETVFAFVEQGTFRIDGAIPVLGDHEDKALSGGHFYSTRRRVSPLPRSRSTACFGFSSRPRDPPRTRSSCCSGF